MHRLCLCLTIQRRDGIMMAKYDKPMDKDDDENAMHGEFCAGVFLCPYTFLRR